MRKKSNGLIFPQDKLKGEYDPDPITILMLCFAGVTMVASVATAITQIFEQIRERRGERFENQRKDAFEILDTVGQLYSKGSNIHSVIDSIQRDASIALTFLNQPEKQENKMIFKLGNYPIQVSGSNLEIWNLLVDDVCTNIKMMNRFILDYTYTLDSLLNKARYFSPELSREVMFLIERIYGRAESFREEVTRFQGLTARASLSRAKKVFLNLCDEADGLISSITDITHFIQRKMRL